MREKHELERGVICEKCLKIASKKEYTRINFVKPVVSDSTGTTKVVSRMNLCNDCYEELKGLLEVFTGRAFVEKTDITSKKEELKSLRDKMLNAKNEKQDGVVSKSRR